MPISYVLCKFNFEKPAGKLKIKQYLELLLGPQIGKNCFSEKINLMMLINL